MKLKNLFLALMAGVAALVGCEPEVDYGPAKISINPETLTFTKADGAEEVSLLSTRDWMVTGTPDWIVLSASEGKASVENQKVKVSVLANNGHNRSASLVFTIGYAKATLNIEQEGPEGKIETGSGTKEDPYTVAGVVAYVNELGGDVESPSKVYVKGKISRIASAGSYSESGTYGNATFYISDDGTQNNEFYCYRILYLGNEKFKSGDSDIKTGDDVVIYGKVVNFKGNTPETVQSSSFLFSLNGVDKGGDGGDADAGPMEGDGSQASPFNVSAARNAVKDLTWTSNTVYQKMGPFYVKGKVKSIDENFSASFGNATFTMMDEGYEKATFIAYRILYLNNKKWVNGDTALQVGDEVIICAELMNYRGNTPETVANSGYVYSLNGETGGGGGNDDPGTPEGDGSQANPYNVAAAINAVKDLTWTSNTEYQSTDVVYMKGKISKIADKGTFGESGTYGNASFYITDEGTNNEFYCFRILYLGNDKFASGQTDIKVGDEVIICGKLMNYRGNTPETVANEAYLYSLNGVTEAGGGGGGGNDDPGSPEGDGSEANPYNVAAALNAVKDLTWTANDNYQSTDVVYVKGKISRIANNGQFSQSGDYGNASFYISDDGSESNEFYCFRILYLGNEKYTSGTDIQVGDDVVICGKLMNYKGNTPETVANEAYLYSLVSNGGSGGGGEGGEGGEGGDPTVLYTDLSQVIALADNAVANFEGVVAAVTSNSFVVTDGTNNVYTFKPVTMAAIGDKVKVEGTKTTYGGIPEIAQGAKVTVLSSGNPVVYPESRVITSSFDNYSASVSEFIEFTGTLTKSGNYYNVTVAGATAYTGSVSNPVASLGLDALDGKEVVFKGYFVGMSGNPAKYVNLACVSAAATDGTIPGGGSDPGTGGQPGGDDPGDGLVINLNSSASTWASDSDSVYGTGFSTTVQGIKLAYYKYKNNQNPVSPTESCIRVYKSGAFVITAPEGKTIKSLLFTAAGDNNGQYCVDLTTLEGGGTATVSANVSALTIGPWEGSANKVAFQTAAGQARLAKVKVVME